MSTSTATAYKYSVVGHLSFGAPKCEKAQKSSGFWANRTYRLCIKDNVLIDEAEAAGCFPIDNEKVIISSDFLDAMNELTEEEYLKDVGYPDEDF